MRKSLTVIIVPRENSTHKQMYKDNKAMKDITGL